MAEYCPIGSQKDSTYIAEGCERHSLLSNPVKRGNKHNGKPLFWGHSLREGYKRTRSLPIALRKKMVPGSSKMIAMPGESLANNGWLLIFWSSQSVFN